MRLLKTLGLISFLWIVFLTIPSVSYSAWSEQSRSASDIEVTVDTVTTRARELIDDAYSQTGTVRYSSSTYYSLINQAHRLMAIKTGAMESYATQDLVGGTTEYALPTSCVFIKRVTIDIDDGNGHQLLPQKTPFRLDSMNQTWTVETSSQTPDAYYIRNRYIGMYPVPKNGGAELKIWFCKQPTTLDSGDDKPFDGLTVLESYWSILAYYAAAMLALQEGNTDLYTTLGAEFKAGIDELTNVLRYNPNFQPDNLVNP